jgi:hypothetical protein
MVDRLDCRRIAAVVVAVAVALLPAAALADGDPASDVLLFQHAFVPWDSGAAGAQQRQLDGVLAASAHSGYPVRVALIASPTDLGSVTALWHQPQSYARYLDEELSLQFKGPVVVVMPNGIGLAAASGLTAAEQAALGHLKAPAGTGSSKLEPAAVAAISTLAAAAGHPLPGNPGESTPTATPGGTSSSSNPGPVIALIAGLALIGLAWGFSFRARRPSWTR